MKCKKSEPKDCYYTYSQLEGENNCITGFLSNM